MTHDLGEQNLTLLEQGRKKATTIAVEAELPEGKTTPGEVSGSISTDVEKKRWSLSLTAWVKRKFQKDGTSAGGKAEFKF